MDPEIYAQVLDKVQADAALKEEDKKLSAILPYSMFLNTMDTIREANQTPNKRAFKCFAGEKFLVIGRKGDVSPCELLDKKYQMGNLKDYDWDIQKLLKSQEAKKVVHWVGEEHCACTWECAIQSSKLFDFRQWPKLAQRGIKIIVKK